MVPTGQLKCAQVLATRNFHTPWPMVITNAACTHPRSRKTEKSDMHVRARSPKCMPYLCEGLAIASAPVLPVGAYKRGPVGLEKSCFVACLASLLQASKPHQRHLETSAPASYTVCTLVSTCIACAIKAFWQDPADGNGCDGSPPNASCHSATLDGSRRID